MAKPLWLAYTPKVQQTLEAEAKQRNLISQVSDVIFGCDATLVAGTVFSVKGNNQKFVIVLNNGKNYQANRLLKPKTF